MLANLKRKKLPDHNYKYLNITISSNVKYHFTLDLYAGEIVFE